MLWQQSKPLSLLLTPPDASDTQSSRQLPSFVLAPHTAKPIVPRAPNPVTAWGAALDGLNTLGSCSLLRRDGRAGLDWTGSTSSPRTERWGPEQLLRLQTCGGPNGMWARRAQSHYYQQPGKPWGAQTSSSVLLPIRHPEGRG